MKNRQTKLTWMAAGATSALLLAACGGGSSTAKISSNAPTDHVLHLSFLEDPGQPPDPDVYYAGQGLALTVNMYEGLLTYKLGSATPQIVGQLATAYTVSSDKKVYTLTLRKGVTFHDGTPFTSAAVKPSFDRRLAVNGGPAYMVSDVASVETPATDKVVITLKDSNSSFLDYLASPYGPKMMSPTGLAANAGSDHDQKYLQTHDLGTGAYTLTDAKVGTHYSMKAYPGWWGPKPYFTSVDMPVIQDLSTQQLEFNNGQLAAIMHDLNAPAVKSYLNNPNVSTYAQPSFLTGQVYLNPNSGLLKSKDARVAFQQSLNIPELVNQVYKGRGTVSAGNYAKGMIPGGIDKQTVTYDPAALKSIAASASASDKQLTFGYDTSQPDDQQLANIVAADLQADGLTVKVQGYPTSQVFGWVTDLKGAPNVLFTEMWPDAAHPYTWAHILYAPDGGLNYLHCSDPTVTSMLPAALKSGSDEQFAQIGQLATATGCWVNIVNRADFEVAQTWLKGVKESHNIAAPTTLIFSGLSVG
jgi:peptide/nickel transport system substrate-binding protein